MIDEDAAAAIDAQSGTSTSGKSRQDRGIGGIWSPSVDGIPAGPQYGDTGGASRFYYCAKASRSERGDGNLHPTVKPLSLMQWLVRMVTPPGGIVLDPFMGSGSTGVAAVREGFNFIGIEMSEQYAEIAVNRLPQQSVMKLGL